MAVEVWYRNPHNYVREVVEAGVCNIAWDRGQIVKSKVDIIKHAELYFGKTYPWRLLAIGVQGTAEYRSGDTEMSPTAVYPTWEYGDEQALLEEMVANPVGEDPVACADKSLPGDERPVFGQEHRVVITNIPPANTGPGRAFINFLKVLQEDYPDCIIHVHGLYSWRVMFGVGFRSVDVDPRTGAQKGKVTIPPGKEMKWEMTFQTVQWVRILGYKPKDLSIPRNRCIYNILSAEWAAKNFGKDVNYRTIGGVDPDVTSSDAEHKPIATLTRLASPQMPKEGDKFHCNTCSLQNNCKYFREGAVCSVPGAEPKELATFFNTRDSATIVEGLGILAGANARRLQKGMAQEDSIGIVDPEVTKLVGQVFEQGTKLAKLIDPALRGGTRVQVNVGQAGAVAVGADPRQAVALAFRELESRGIPREQITSEMIAQVLASAEDPDAQRRAVEGARVIEAQSSVI